MPKLTLKLLSVLVAIALFAWFGMFLARKIDLTTADLGRHIQNGNIIVHGSWHDKWAVLHTNFYSYTLPDAPFVNHHWGTGVLFYFLWSCFGFTGLSLFYIALGLATLWLFFDVARKASNFFIAAILTILLIPLFASRAEVRPEMITYFFTGVFFWVVWSWSRSLLANQLPPTPSLLKREGAGEKSSHWMLWALPAVMLLWVNLHIGFVFGFLVLGAFGLEQLAVSLFVAGRPSPIGPKVSALFKPGDFRTLLLVSLGCVVAGLVNPFGYKLLLFPLEIFKNYGYLIVENQSISFLEKINFTNGQHFLLFKIAIGLAAASFVAVAFKQWRKIDLAGTVLVLVTGLIAYKGIRHFPTYSFFLLPVIAGYIYVLKPKQLHIAYKAALVMASLAVAGTALFSQYQTFQVLRPILGTGLMFEVNASADFYKNNNITGPIFNNYDIGGYLIYHLHDSQAQVFVDNRPEAYTVDFFERMYKTPQTDNTAWSELDSKYHFNSIFFSYRDYTPWAQQFLIARVQDPAWAPVFVDGYNIIFLRRDNPENAEVIKNHLLPPSMFGVK